MASKTTTASQLRSKIRWGIIGIFALIFVSAAYDVPTVVNKGINAINNSVALGIPNIPENSFSLGLDLQGGASLIYETDTSALSADEKAEGVEGARDVIERRVNGLGVSEPEVRSTRVGDVYRINVELPGVTDINAAIQMIGETPILEFKEENNIPPRDLTQEEQASLDAYNATAKEKAGAAQSKINAGEDFGAVVAEFSEDSFSVNNDGYLGYTSAAVAPDEIYSWAAAAAEGDITSELIQTVEGYNILKRGGEQDGDEQVTASHILICFLGARNCDSATYTKEEAREKAQSIFDEATAENFADLAREYSTEPGAAESGGDLGTFGRGVMIPEFEEAVFSAEPGQIIGPVQTEFGFHIIYKRAAETAKEYELSRILVRTQSARDILPSQDQWMNTGLSGKQLERAEVVSDPTTGLVQVSLQFDGEGKDLFADLTERHVGDPIAIFLDGEPISVPVVQTPIRDGRAVITGDFNIKDAQLLAQRLNAGALPVPVELVSEQTVGATLGAASLESSLRAGFIAMLVVMLFMLLYYRLPGFLSIISLTLYISLTLALFKLIGVTLTLAGIAGFILSIGMAVDANVLIFERLKEELREGKSLKAAVEEGFLRAWTSIRDGNVSTLITCALLISFGSSFVQGFAVTLGIGVLISMFTAIVITRVMLRFVVPWFARRGNWMFLGFSKQSEKEQ
jgi:protein-export membrane protein SecD